MPLHTSARDRTLVERYLATIEAVARSPRVSGFVVGFTGNCATRARQYRRVKFPHFIILADRLVFERALTLENALQEVCKDAKGIVRAKYHPDKLGDASRKSAGGKKDDGLKRYSVYMACYAPAHW